MKIRTYADGFGLWHAVVPAIGTVRAQRERARRAIAQEVCARQGDQDPLIRLSPVPPIVVQRSAVRVWQELPA